ncbi:serpin family protein [Streptomyces sp. NPDC051940]|uniref:serpin family protein n=1 Tax=Streptomyces sp. NPDC051940 TaxID=3155675 RepID=UPI00341AABC2
MTTRRTFLLAALGLLAASCGDGDSGPPGDAARINAELVADLRPGDARAVAEAVDAFGFDLMREVAASGRNTVISPVSVAALLALLLAGAGGETARAMGKVLHLADSRDVRVGALLRTLADTEDVTLDVSNALWAAEGLRLREDYRTYAERTFGATVDQADFAAPETAREIDHWVDERTHGRIDKIAEDLGLPDPAVLVVLVNAVYFLGKWTFPFRPEDTRDEDFQLAPGQSAKVPMMNGGARLDHAQRYGYQMLRLPYGKSKRYGMEILLPDLSSDGLPALLDQLDLDEWRAAVGALTGTEVGELALPRFELTWSRRLNDSLRALGMGPAFAGDVDFSRMTAERGALDVVAHKTYIRVDEKGTEAAAVSGGSVLTSEPAIPPLVFRVDRPFAFTISDRTTGAVLFLGAVNDPRG